MGFWLAETAEPIPFSLYTRDTQCNTDFKMFLRLLVVCYLASVICGMTIPPTPKDAEETTPKEKKEEFEKEFIRLLVKYEEILPEIQGEFFTKESANILDYDSYSDSYSFDGDVTSEEKPEADSEESDSKSGSRSAERTANSRRRRCVPCGCSKLPAGLSEDAAYSWLDFSNNGILEVWLALFNPWKAMKIKEFADDSKADAASLYPSSLHNGEGDAFRHALWMYRVTKKYGSSVAKDFGDAHERSSVNALNERLMDLYNNEVGRCLGSNPANHGRDDIDVIRDALNSGKLQIRLDTSYHGNLASSGSYYGRK